MSYLKAVPRSFDLEPPARAVTVVSPGARDVVYLDQSASIEIITEALKAWGLRVRAERASGGEAAGGAPSSAAEGTWQTTRPDAKAPTRLENALSPLWFPIRDAQAPVDPASDWGWFGRAA